MFNMILKDIFIGTSFKRMREIFFIRIFMFINFYKHKNSDEKFFYFDN